MTPDAFPRLALVAACSAYMVGLIVVWQQLGWLAAIVALVGGTVLAVVVTIEPSVAQPDTIDVDGKPVDADFVRALLHRRRKDPEHVREHQLMRPLLDLRDPDNQATLGHVSDIRRGLGKTTCQVLDVLATDPDRQWSHAHVAQQCRMLKPVAKLTLHTLTTQRLAVRTRDRYAISQLGLTVAYAPAGGQTSRVPDPHDSSAAGAAS